MLNIYDVTTAILKREGRDKFTNHPADKGGPTKWGITAVTLGRWRGYGSPATEAEVRALTEAEARRIYEVFYYEAPRYSRLGDPQVETLLYDITVTSGPRQAAKLLQRALGLPEADVDGVIGQRTLRAWRAAVPAVIYRALAKERVRFMVRIALAGDDVRAHIDAHPETQLRNLAGWVNRSLEFL